MITHLTNEKRKFSTTAVNCCTILTQVKGLMFTPPLRKDHAIIIKFKKEKNIPIHMFFVFYPIDAVWLDKEYKIVHIERNIRPFTPLINPNVKARAILETEKYATANLKVGDKLTAKIL